MFILFVMYSQKVYIWDFKVYLSSLPLTRTIFMMAKSTRRDDPSTTVTIPLGLVPPLYSCILEEKGAELLHPLVGGELPRIVS
jgi:hypothetical protein